MPTSHSFLPHSSLETRRPTHVVPYFPPSIDSLQHRRPLHRSYFFDHTHSHFIHKVYFILSPLHRDPLRTSAFSVLQTDNRKYTYTHTHTPRCGLVADDPRCHDPPHHHIRCVFFVAGHFDRQSRGWVPAAAALGQAVQRAARVQRATVALHTGATRRPPFRWQPTTPCATYGCVRYGQDNRSDGCSSGRTVSSVDIETVLRGGRR